VITTQRMEKGLGTEPANVLLIIVVDAPIIDLQDPVFSGIETQDRGFCQPNPFQGPQGEEFPEGFKQLGSASFQHTEDAFSFGNSGKERVRIIPGCRPESKWPLFSGKDLSIIC